MLVLINKCSSTFLKYKQSFPILTHFYCKETCNYDIKIGNVKKTVFVPNQPHLVPNLYFREHKSENLIQHLQWIMKKDLLGQDIFLIGFPGPLRNRIIKQYLEMMRREMEYVVLSRDTTENDLKQRRELHNGTAHYINQSAVKAAIEGRFLILDGVEKVERNVLPVLNNLLENREMQLEDGRFLIAADKYDKLLLEHPKSVLDEWKLVRVSENFRVVALGLPVPQFKGNPLDPPFRSRFQARHIQVNFDEQFSEVKALYTKIPEVFLKKFISACHTFLSDESIQLGLPKFPIENISLVLSISNELSGLPLKNIFNWIYPHQSMLSKSQQDSVNAILKQFSIASTVNLQSSVSKNKDIKNYIFTHSVEFKTKSEKRIVPALGGENLKEVELTDFVSNAYHEKLLTNMCLTHLSHDFCLLGNRGSGKRTLAKKFASLFNYPIETVMLYNDMTARDLLQQRVTDEKGNTLWRPSQIVQAAKDGKLLILDGLHRLHPSTLSVLQNLIHDREIQLYDGLRLLRYDRFDDLKFKLSLSEEQLNEKGILRIHPAFRIIALAEPPKTKSTSENWMNSQVLSMFLFHEIRPLSLNEEKIVIQTITKCPSNKMDLLLDFTHEMRSSNDEALKNVSASFSTRQLVKIAQRLSSFPDENVYDLVKQSCLFEFLPHLTKQAVESVLKSCSIEKSVALLNKKQVQELDDTLVIGSTNSPIYNAGLDKLKVPNVLFYETQEHIQIMEAMLQNFVLGEHLLLVGNQGVGKNKITDRFLQLLNRPREYIQLHRDTTVQSLTQQPTVKDGKIIYEDSPLLNAVKYGRVLVVDEADKAPTHVTTILKALVVSGEMTLSDGRCIIHFNDSQSKAKSNIVIMHPDFRMIVLANRPGFPFLGNDFFSTLGDIFSCHAVENPSLESQISMLQQYGPNVPQLFLRKLANLFGDLRSMSDAGLISYPYSTREVVNIIKHLNKFPEEGIPYALKNVFDFDVYNSEFKDVLSDIFQKHGIPLEQQKLSVKMAKKYKLPELVYRTKWELPFEFNVLQTKMHDISFINQNNLFVKNISVENIEPRSSTFSELKNCYQLHLNHNDAPLNIKAVENQSTDLIYIATANPISITKINCDKSLAHKIELSAYFPTVRSGYKPKIDLCPLHISGKEFALFHERVTNQTFLIDFFDGNVKKLNIHSLFDEAISKINDLVYSKGQNFEMHTLPSRDKVILYDKLGTKFMLVDFTKNQTYQCNIAEPINNVCIKDNESIIILGNESNFFIDLSDINNWKIKNINVNVDSNIAIKSLKSSNNLNKSTALMSSENDYASLIEGSFILDNDLIISSFPREESVVSHEKACILPVNHQIIRLLHQLPKKITSQGNKNVSFLEVVDLKDSTYSYIDIDIPYNVSSFANWLADTSRPYFLMCTLNDDKLVTVDIRGSIRKWELDLKTLETSFTNWKKIVGADREQQLTIERIDNKELSSPKHGKIDPTGAPHVGGNTWAGGTGGRDTAGLGGRGGPYRLDAGHNVFQVSDKLKESVPPEVRQAAREMGRKAYKEKLKEIEMSEYDAELYENFLNGVDKQRKTLCVILDSLQAKSKERQWLKHQTSGEFDDSKLVEGITGEKSIYRKRGFLEPEMGAPQQKPKLLRLVVDVSGSMYRFNGHDARLQRELESVVLLMEAFENYHEKIRYQIVGHSGEEFCLEFSKFDAPPKNRKERLHILRNMIAHSQFCASGDNTLEATENAIKTITKEEADEYFVIVMSDANFDRYGISPAMFAKLLVSDPKVNAFAIFIGSLGDQAAILHKQLPAGRGFVCFDSSQLTQILQQIFTSALLRE